MYKHTKRSKKRSKKRKYNKKLIGGSESTFISGQAFKNLCKYNLDNRYTIIPLDSSLTEGDKVFLKLGDIPSFLQNPPSKKVTLVVANMDETFDDNQIKAVSPYTTDVYSINCSAKDAKQIPIGFRDDQYTSHSVMTDILNDTKITGEKDTLCLVNFLVGTNHSERSKARDRFKGESWATLSEGYMNYDKNKSLNHANSNTKEKRKDFYKQLKRTKCVVCPPGSGVDTHRVYEALYFGAIPIIKTSFLDPMYEKLGGCWIVKDWSEVTEESCNDHWNNKQNTQIPFLANEWFKEKQLGGGVVRNEIKCKYISSRGILKSCDIYFAPDDYVSWEKCNDFDKYCNMKYIKDGSVVFVKFECLKNFIKKMDNMSYKIVLVTGNGDRTFPDDYYSKEEFENVIKNDKILHMFCNNTTISHPKLTIYPIGIDYLTLTVGSQPWGSHMSPLDQEKELENIKSKTSPFYERLIKCYSNFHFNMKTERKYTKDRRDAKDQIPPECMYYEPTSVSRKETWENQSKYAFVVSPHGNGLDCYRQWEALCLGCIPVVKKSSIDALYDELPVLIVNEWSDINENLLNNTIEKFRNMTFNYDRLLLKYWMDKIRKFSEI